MRILYGLTTPDAGSIRVDGRAGRHPLAARRHRGRRRHGHPALLAGAADDRRRERRPGADRAGCASTSTRARRDVVEAASERFGIAVRPGRRACSDLSVGEQQRVEILKALSRDCRVLILDEPTAVLVPAGGGRALRDPAPPGRPRGSRSSSSATSWARCAPSATASACCAAGGWWARCPGGHRRARAGPDDGRPADLRRRPAGDRRRTPAQPRPPDARPVRDRAPRPAGAARRHRCEVARGRDRGRGRRVRQRPDGAGRGALRHAPPRPPAPSCVDGRDLAGRRPAAVMAAGVGRIPEDRHASLVLDLSVAHEPDPGAHRRLHAARRPRSTGASRAHARELDRRSTSIKARPDDRVGTLSGGNIQKVLLARVLSREPAGDRRLAAHARPGRGRHRVRARASCSRAGAAGAAILLFSEDLDELLALSDRLVVLYEGRIVGEHAAPTRPTPSAWACSWPAAGGRVSAA